MARTCVAASSQWLTVATPALTAVPITLAAWFNPASIGGNNILGIYSTANDGTNPNEEWSLRLSAPDLSANTRAGGVGGAQAISTVTPTANVWQHGCAVFAANNDRRCYLNGANKGTDVTPRTPGTVDNTSMGSNSVPKNFFDGLFAEAAIWNIALSDADVASLAVGVPPFQVRPAACVAYWSLYGQFSPEIDLIGRLNLTITGATAGAHPRMYRRVNYTPRKTGLLFTLAGVTRDAGGVPLGGCVVHLFKTATDVRVGSTVSDGSGNFSFTGSTLGAGGFYVVAYLAGAPDRAGTTVNTLLGV